MGKNIFFISQMILRFCLHLRNRNANGHHWRWLLSEPRRTLARRGSCCRCSRRRVFGHQSTRPMTSIVVDRLWMSRSMRLPGAIPRPSSCMPNPKSWSMSRRRRTASSGLARSTKRWWCHCGPRCANACRHSSPTTRPCSPCRRMCRASHQVRQWRCSSIRCVRSGSTLVYSWSSSRPWRCDPNRRRQWSDWPGWARSERTRPNRCAHLLGWCTCTRRECSTTWWSCRESLTRSDGCQRRKRLRERPKKR